MNLFKLVFLSFILFVTSLIFPQTFAYAQMNIQSAPPGSLPSASVPWIEDEGLTYATKSMIRARDFLDLSLQSPQASPFNSGKNNPLANLWTHNRNIIYAFFSIAILFMAGTMIVTRGNSITLKKILPLFILSIVLVTLSFSIVQFIYIITDIIQGFFAKTPTGATISSNDIINLKVDYNTFIGYRLDDISYNESVSATVTLLKNTRVIYYLVGGILIVRKIILLFFLILSPFFPLLILFPLGQNTAKIWLREFFRWLLYGPLFMVLLAGMVFIWKTDMLSSLKFSGAHPTSSYPTATNLFLSGPIQNPTSISNITSPEAFTLYMISLAMLVVVIIIPFFLIRISFIQTQKFASSNLIIQQLKAKLLFKKDNFQVDAPDPSNIPKNQKSQEING